MNGHTHTQIHRLPSQVGGLPRLPPGEAAGAAALALAAIAVAESRGRVGPVRHPVSGIFVEARTTL